MIERRQFARLAWREYVPQLLTIALWAIILAAIGHADTARLFAATVMIEDADAARPGLQPAIVIDLARGKRLSIFTSASPALVASALKALR